MNHRLRFLLVICSSLLFCMPAFTQSNFTPGTVQLRSGESQSGFIRFGGLDVTPKTIFFKQTAEGTEQSFTPADIKGFTLEGGATYIAQIVWKDILPVTRKDAVLPGVEANVRDNVFLKQLATGPTLTLYELKEDKAHFYIKKPDGEVSELLYKVFRNTNTKDNVLERDNVIIHSIFRNQLRIYALEDEGLVSKIDNASFTASDLTRMVNGINALASDAYRNPAGGGKRIGFGAGLTTGNQFSFSGNTYQQLSELKGLTSGGTVIKANADFFGKRSMKNTFVRTEVAYSHFAYRGGFQRSATADYFLTINTFSTTLSVAQNLVHGQDFQLYVGAGTGINFSSYPLNDIVSTNPNSAQEDWLVRKVWPEVLALRSGVVFKGINAEIAYRVAGSPFNYPSLRSNYTMLALTLGYSLRLE